MKNNIIKLSLLISVLLSPALSAAPPAQAVIADTDNLTASLTEIDYNAQSYQRLVTVKNAARITVKWNVWEGDGGTSAKVLVNDIVHWSGSSADQRATFTIRKGGKYQLQVELCNSEGCSSSKIQRLIVADTDGSHLEPMEVALLEHNQPYQNRSAKVIAATFTEWGGDDGYFPVSSIPAQNLTHLLYAEVPICGGETINATLKNLQPQRYESLMLSCAGRQDFNVALLDPYAAAQNSEGINGQDSYKGHFGQLMALKRAYPQLKILPSIGGATLSDPFWQMDDPQRRKVFVDSVKVLLQTWKFFDGVNIDWQYPGGGGADANSGKPTDGTTLLSLMKELRAMMDQLSVQSGKQYQLTAAVGGSAERIARVNYGEVQRYLDNIFLSGEANAALKEQKHPRHQSALYDERRPAIDSSVRALLDQGVNSQKIVLGLASYARGWQGVDGIQQDGPFGGRAEGPLNGSREASMISYRNLVRDYSDSHWQAGYDDKAEVPFLFSKSARKLLSYDDPRSVKAKGQYVYTQRLGGLFISDISADNGDLLNAMHEGLGNGDSSLLPENQPPVADAGLTQHITGAERVTLNGSHSSDPEGGSLSWHWQQISGPPVTLEDADQPQAHISLGAIDQQTEYIFTLTVTDDHHHSSSAKVKIIEHPL